MLDQTKTFRTRSPRQWSAGLSPSTDVDRDLEEVLKTRLRSLLAVPVLAEETGLSRASDQLGHGTCDHTSLGVGRLPHGTRHGIGLEPVNYPLKHLCGRGSNLTACRVIRQLRGRTVNQNGCKKLMKQRVRRRIPAVDSQP